MLKRFQRAPLPVLAAALLLPKMLPKPSVGLLARGPAPAAAGLCEKGSSGVPVAKLSLILENTPLERSSLLFSSWYALSDSRSDVCADIGDAVTLAIFSLLYFGKALRLWRRCAFWR